MGHRVPGRTAACRATWEAPLLRPARPGIAASVEEVGVALLALFGICPPRAWLVAGHVVGDGHEGIQDTRVLARSRAFAQRQIHFERVSASKVCREPYTDRRKITRHGRPDIGQVGQVDGVAALHFARVHGGAPFEPDYRWGVSHHT